jgi:hypothetical protein
MSKRRPLLESYVRLAAAAITTAALLPWAVPAANAAPRILGSNECDVSMDTPHYSDSEAGVIAKGRWWCDLVPTTVYLSTHTTGLELYLCQKDPEHNIGWLNTYCALKGCNKMDVHLTLSGKRVTRYVPAEGPAHGAGYWISVSTWYDSGPGGTSPDTTSYSRVWEGHG